MNMQKQGHSYLDLSVLPELRTSILSSDGVVLFNSELTSIIWANASGARLFGGKGVADLLRAKLSDDQAMVRQIRNSATQLKGNKPITRGFRLKQGARSILLQFEIRSIRLPDKDSGILVTSYADHDEQETEENMAAGAVESLDGFADAAAILDDFGMPIASSQDFADLGPDEDVLAGLINELRDEDDRLIKRPVPGLSGNIMAIGLARLTDEPGRNLLVLADTNEPADAPTENGDALLEEEVSVPLHSAAETILFLGNFLLSFLTLGLCLIFLLNFYKNLLFSNANFLLIFSIILLFVVFSIFIISFDNDLIFAIPFCVIPLTLRAFFDFKLSLGNCSLLIFSKLRFISFLISVKILYSPSNS